jgi:hypothetical protein
MILGIFVIEVSPKVVAYQAAFTELAQHGRSIKRATQMLSEFLWCLAARIRALCASEQLACRLAARESYYRTGLTSHRVLWAYVEESNINARRLLRSES